MTGSRDTFHGSSGNPGDPEGLLGGRVLGGSGPPEAEYGGVNDWYIDEDLMVLYGPKKVAGWGEGAVRLFIGVNVESLTASKDLSVGDAGIQRLCPYGEDRDVNLPAASGDIVGAGFYINNTSTGYCSLIVKDNGIEQVVVPPAGTALVYCAFPTGWRVLSEYSGPGRWERVARWRRRTHPGDGTLELTLMTESDDEWIVEDGYTESFIIELTASGQDAAGDRVSGWWRWIGSVERDDTEGIFGFLSTPGLMREQRKDGIGAELSLDAGTKAIVISVTGLAGAYVGWEARGSFNRRKEHTDQ